MQSELQEAAKVNDTNMQLSRELEKTRKQLEAQIREMEKAKDCIYRSETVKEVQKAEQA